MKRVITIVLALLLLTICGGAQAAFLTVDVNGLESLAPDTIWTYQINFDIIGYSDWFVPDSSVVFNEVDQHKWEVIPTVFVTNWNLDSNVNAGQLVILADDKGFGDPAVSPLVNGNLFSVQYPDDVQLSLAFDSFVLGSDLTTRVEMATIPLATVFGAGDNTLTFTPTAVIPIPPAILLLGSGLLGLVAIKRKRA